MFENSFLKFMVVFFSGMCVVCAILTMILKISPIYAIIVFIITLILNIIDNIVTSKAYKKDMKKIQDDMQSLKKRGNK